MNKNPSIELAEWRHVLLKAIAADIQAINREILDLNARVAEMTQRFDALRKLDDGEFLL